MNNTIDLRFYRTSLISKEEVEDANQILANYTKNKSKEHDLINYYITEGKDNYNNNHRDRNNDLEALLRGDINNEELQKLFPVSGAVTEAISLMNTKASIFDVNQISVELQSSVYDEPDSDDTQKQEAGTFINTFNKVLNDTIMKTPEIKDAITDAIKYSRGYPIAITQIGWDDNLTLGSSTNFKGTITCENIPIQNFFWDPTATSIDKCEFVFVTKHVGYRAVASFLSQLKKHDLKLFNAYYISLKTSQALISKSGSETSPTEYLVQHGALELVSVYVKQYDSDNNVKGIKVYHVVGDSYVVGEQMIDSITYLPFSILKEYSMPNAFTGISSVMLASSLIKQKYFIDGACNNITLLQKSPTYLYDIASQLDGDKLLNWQEGTAGSAHGVQANGNINSIVAMLPTPTIPQELLQWRNIIDQELQKIVSITDYRNFGSQISGAAVQNAISQESIKENTSISELERYLVRMVRIFLQLFKKHLPKKSMNSTLDFVINPTKDSEGTGQEVVSLSPKAFEKLEADVIIDAELLKTSRKNKMLQDALQVMQMEMQYLGQAKAVTLLDIVKLLKLPNADAVAERLKNTSEQATLNAAQQAVDLVAQVIQAKQDPNVMEQNPEVAQMSDEQLIQIVASIIKGGQ